MLDGGLQQELNTRFGGGKPHHSVIDVENGLSSNNKLSAWEREIDAAANIAIAIHFM